MAVIAVFVFNDLRAAMYNRYLKEDTKSMNRFLAYIFIVQIVLSACSAPAEKEHVLLKEVLHPLPLVFWDVQETMDMPTTRETEPFPCQPAYFIPSKDLPAPNDAIVQRVTFGNTVVEVSRYQVPVTPPYSIMEYSLRDPYGDCRTGAIEILKDGKFYALYTHMYQNEEGSNEWTFNSVTHELIIHNRHLLNSRWVEQVRRINLDTKESLPLPLDPCFIHAFIVDDGSIVSTFQDFTKDGAVVYCGITSKNQLFAKVHAEGVGGSSVIMPGFHEEKRLFYFVDPNSQVSGIMPDQHLFIVVSIDEPHTWAAFQFPSTVVFCGGEEVDLSDFTFKKPHVRYRYPLYDPPCLHNTGQMSNWVSLPVRD